MADLENQAVDLESDIDDFFDSHQVENLSSIDDLEDYCKVLGGLKQRYRRIYAHLKRGETEESFGEKYPSYSSVLEKLSNHFKVGNEKLISLRTAARDKKQETENLRSYLDCQRLQKELEVIEKQEKVKYDQCITQREMCVEQIQHSLKNCGWDGITDARTVERQITSLESQMTQFMSARTNYRGVLGRAFDVSDLEVLQELRSQLALGRGRLDDIRKGEELASKLRMENEENERKLSEDLKLRDANDRIGNILTCADTLVFEIKTRYDTFWNKCAVQWSQLSDHEILDLKKREDSFHVELREIIDKISEFEKFVLPCGDSANAMRKRVTSMRNNCSNISARFFKELSDTIRERDISEKKLSSSASLTIKLAKFCGYDSDLDIYSFRSDFRKLIEPQIQKCLWADYLKKNFLGGEALNLVSKEDSIDEIWEKLFRCFGDTRLLLQNKITTLDQFAQLERLKDGKDDEKISTILARLINSMVDLERIAKEFHLENDLYFGVGLHRILEVMGSTRERKFIKSISREVVTPGGKEKWIKLLDFLRVELRERQAYVLNDKIKRSTTLVKSVKDGNGKAQNDPTHVSSNCACVICGKVEDHVVTQGKDGNPCVEYIACKVFVEMDAAGRCQALFKKQLCAKCLLPGAKYGSSHDCDQTYVCNHDYVNSKGVSSKCVKHILVCQYHLDQKRNKDLLELFKRNVIVTKNFPDFSKAIQINFSESYRSEVSKPQSSIFLFQTSVFDGVFINIFYDNGCGGAIISKKLLDQLIAKGRAVVKTKGPIQLVGVNNQTSEAEYGEYIITLPLPDGSSFKFEALCLDQITCPFPKYPLKEVEEDVRRQVSSSNVDLLERLPRLPSHVGGEVGLMIGKPYMRYFPREVTRLESGLTIYEAVFFNPDGTKGTICGPHPAFTRVDRLNHFVQPQMRYTYLNVCARLYDEQVAKVTNAPLLNSSSTGSAHLSECQHENGTEVFASRRSPPKCLKVFDKVDAAGTDISYRCVDCRQCPKCKNGPVLEEVSIQEEMEQALIDKSVTVDTEQRISEASLPFTSDPTRRLSPNSHGALKQYKQQVRNLARSSKDREEAIASEAKLQELGFVDWLENLTEEEQNLILNSVVKYFMPWHVVKSLSISTPIRIVFNCSAKTPSGFSLNDILAKGINSMNNLVEILIRWQTRQWAYHTDIRKMYNAVRLSKAYWCYQLYFWQEDLNPNLEPKIKVVKTVIYGSRPSGQLAERAIRLTAEKNLDSYPKAHRIINDDIYVDDCLSGNDSHSGMLQDTDELKLTLDSGGFTLKGFTVSGRDPDPTLSGGELFVVVGGLKWFPKGDFIMPNIGDLKFPDRVKGKRSPKILGIPDSFTMRDCVSKVAEIFDPVGKITPIIAGFKLDISALHQIGLKWDDEIPDNLRGLWISNFEMMAQIRDLHYRRAIVPQDAKNLDIETLEMGDSSSKAICAAVYARFEKKDGSFSCQLIFSRSKILPDGTSTPRGELLAAELNAATGFTVKRALGENHKKSWKFTDSMVALHWIHCDKNALNTFVRNRITNIARLSEGAIWGHLDGKDMGADLGTR